MRFVEWMATPAGRLVRVAVGLIIFSFGLFIWGAWGLVLAVVGAIPVLTGIFNVILIAPLLGAPFRGGPHAA